MSRKALGRSIRLSAIALLLAQSVMLPAARAAARDRDPSLSGGGSVSLEVPATIAEGTLFFEANDGIHGRELWKSDGTASGTVLLRDIRPGRRSSLDRFNPGLLDVDGTLYFWANDGVHGSELWMSKGTADSTTLVKDIRPGPRGSRACCIPLAAVGGTVYLVANDGVSGTELWRSDGSAVGTVLVKDIWAGPRGYVPTSFTDMAGTLYFLDGSQLWKSDGTKAGTTMIEDFAPAGGIISLTDIGGMLYLSYRGLDGDQLWKSDGTPEGTGIVKDFTAGRSCPAEQLTDLDGTAYFNVGIPKFGEELWRSDGTAIGTHIVNDIWPGRERWPVFDEYCQYGPQDLTVLGDKIYFSTDDGTNGVELWGSDGTETGTAMVLDIVPGPDGSNPGGSVALGGVLYFSANDVVHGYELWRSDGKGLGTMLVKDIMAGTETSYPHELTSGGDVLFFAADDGQHGQELWTSRGSEVGTAMVIDIDAGPLGSSPRVLTFVPFA